MMHILYIGYDKNMIEFQYMFERHGYIRNITGVMFSSEAHKMLTI